jgi:hypothetical protein
MLAVNQKAKKVLDKLVAGLDVGEGKKVDNAGKAFMPVHVDRLTDDLFAVAHYYYQNGDAMADPDVTFWRGPDGKYYPTSMTQAAFGQYQEVVFLDGGKVNAWKPRAYNDLRKFCGQWLTNVKRQQGL